MRHQADGDAPDIEEYHRCGFLPIGHGHPMLVLIASLSNLIEHLLLVWISGPFYSLYSIRLTVAVTLLLTACNFPTENCHHSDTSSRVRILHHHQVSTSAHPSISSLPGLLSSPFQDHSFKNPKGYTTTSFGVQESDLGVSES